MAGDAPARQRRLAAVGKPDLGLFLVAERDRLQRHLLMIAHEVDGAVDQEIRLMGKQAEHAGGVGTTVDIVAEMDQRHVGGRADAQVESDLAMQQAEAFGAAVDVADGIDPAAWGKCSRRRREIQQPRHGQPVARVSSAAFSGRVSRA